MKTGKTTDNSFVDSVRERVSRMGEDEGAKAEVSANASDDGAAETPKKKKGFWAKHTERLENTHCTQTPPECR